MKRRLFSDYRKTERVIIVYSISICKKKKNLVRKQTNSFDRIIGCGMCHTLVDELYY